MRAAPRYLGQPEVVDQPPGAPLAALPGTRKARRQQHVLLAAQLLDQVKRLKHEAHVAQPRAREPAWRHARELLAGEHDLPGIGEVERAE